MNSTTDTPSDIRHPLSRFLPTTPEGPMRSPARVLGWFSIALGLAEVVMPRALARAAGSPNLPWLTRAHGLREIGVGVGLLTAKDPQPWLWARVGGDALDVATVAPGMVTSGKPLRTLISLAALGSIAWIDFQTAQGAAPKPGASGESLYGYGARSGFPRPAHEMRGAAKKTRERSETGDSDGDGSRVRADEAEPDFADTDSSLAPPPVQAPKDALLSSVSRTNRIR